jgi:hypothetical protein
VQCVTKNGQLPRQAKRILRIALSNQPTEDRLIAAARMITDLAPNHFVLATEVLEEFTTSQAINKETVSDAVMGTLQAVLIYPFGEWVQHSSSSDRKKLIDKIGSMEPRLACMFLTAVCHSYFEESRNKLNAIEQNQNIDSSVRNHIPKLLKKHSDGTSSDFCQELQNVLFSNI